MATRIIVGLEKVGEQCRAVGNILNGAYREPVVAIVVVRRVEIVAVEVHVVRVVLIVGRGRPIVAVVTHIVDIRAVAVARRRRYCRDYFGWMTDGGTPLSLLYCSTLGYSQPPNFCHRGSPLGIYTYRADSTLARR